MTGRSPALAVDLRAALPRPGSALDASRERQSVGAVGLYAVTLFVFPADVVIRAVGAQGFVAGLVGLGLLATWLVAILLGHHDPLAARHPTRPLVAWFAVMSLISWALTPFHQLTATERLSADRWVMLVAASAGVVLVCAEGITSVRGLVTVLRLTVLGGAFCAAVALVQWVFRFDVSALIRESLPGFTVNGSHAVFTPRGALTRVNGTAVHPIELGVVAGMVMPLAVAVAMSDHTRSALRRWTPVLLIGLAIPASVSRSAVLSVGAAMAVLVLGLPARQRVSAMLFVPLGAAVLVLARPGYLHTLASFVGAGENDASVAARLQDYPLVAARVAEHRWFGSGGGTYFFTNAFDILDNQYLKSAIELGLVGMTGLIAWFVVPVVAALVARRRSRDPVLRLLSTALAGAALAGAVSSATFDSMSFNMFASLQALVVGCVGACAVLARRESGPASPAPRPPGGAPWTSSRS